jgi:glutathione S-transferase
VSASHYTLADAFATAALARFRLHGFEIWWSAGANPSVAAYYRRMQERPSWSAAGVVDSGNERDL